jgi:hypothetical protein
MSLTTDDLRGEVTLNELTALIDAAGGTEIANEIVTEAETLVGLYANRHDIDPEWRKRLVRPIALASLYRLTRSGTIPEKRQRAADAAMSELRDLRDGRFGDSVPRKESMPDRTPPAGGRYGSEPRIRQG